MAPKRSKNRRSAESPPAAMASADDRSAWIKALVIVAAGIGVFAPTLGGTWYGDDPLYITSNPLMYDSARLWKAWFEPGSFIEYYPIEQTLQWCQFQLWGPDKPFPYLVTNLALHLTSALLLWRLFSKLGLRLAWLGGLLFAIYPLLVDSVGVACELKNTLSLPPFLLAMAFYLDYEKSRQRRDYGLALLLFLIAMLCKITMAFFPIVILLYGWWRRGRVTLGDLQASAPFFAISLVLGCLTVHAGAVYAAATHYVSPGAIHLGGPAERIALVGLSLAFYFGHSFLPLHPSPFYPLWQLDPLTPWLYLPWVGIALVFEVCWRKRHGWGRPVLFALAFFALGLAPFLGIIEVSYMCLFWVSDHLLYIPIIPLIGLTVAGIERIGPQLPIALRKPALAILALAIALLGLKTWTYATIFADHEQLWLYILRDNPNIWMVRQQYALLLAGENRNDEAIGQLREVVRLNPDFASAWMILGDCLLKNQDIAGAIHSYRECLRCNPRYDAAHLFLGFSYSKEGRAAEAIAQFGPFERAHPNSIEVHMGLGQALAQENRVPEAISELETAVRLNPNDATLQSELAALREKLSRQNGAGVK